MAKAFLITFLILATFAGFMFYRSGYYKEVTITAGHLGPFVLVYKEHKGSYGKINPVIEEVEEAFEAKGLPCPMAFGRYLHDPNLVEHDRLVSHGGCAFPTDSEKLQSIIKEGTFQTETIEKREYVVALFEGSPSMGPMRVYPEVEDWLNKYGYKNDGPVIELYQTTGEDAVLTRYLFQYK